MSLRNVKRFIGTYQVYHVNIDSLCYLITVCNIHSPFYPFLLHSLLEGLKNDLVLILTTLGCNATGLRSNSF